MSVLPDLLADHFRRPRNSAPLPRVDARGSAANAACGDRLELFLALSEGRLSGLAFRARGCSALIACASLVTERLQGTTPSEAARVDVDELVSRAGGLPPRSGHAAAVVVRAVEGLLADLSSRCHPDAP